MSATPVARPRRAAAGDTGQSTVELALALPLVCLMLLGVLQVALVVRSQLAVQAAARNGARAAAAAATPDAAAAAAHASTSIRPLEVDVAVSARRVTVTVRYTEPTDVPLVGWLLPTVRLRAAVTMPVEPP